MSSEIDLIAHYEDIDGLLCHALAEKAHPYDIIHHDISYGAECKPFQEANSSVIYFCDLGFNSSNSFALALKEIETLRNTGKKVHLFDHHDWSKAKKPLTQIFSEVHHDKRLSSTPILQSYLGLVDDASTYFSSLAYADDHNHSNPQTRALSECLHSGFDIKELISHLAQVNNIDELIPKESIEYIQEYREKISEAIIELQQTYESKEEFNVGLAPRVLYMKKGHRQMKTDFPENSTICFYENTNQALFCAQSHEQFNQILSQLSAGGRDNEGGITLDSIVTKENYPQIKEDILSRIT